MKFIFFKLINLKWTTFPRTQITELWRLSEQKGDSPKWQWGGQKGTTIICSVTLFPDA